MGYGPGLAKSLQTMSLEVGLRMCKQMHDELRIESAEFQCLLHLCKYCQINNLFQLANMREVGNVCQGQRRGKGSGAKGGNGGLGTLCFFVIFCTRCDLRLAILGSEPVSNTCEEVNNNNKMHGCFITIYNLHCSHWI